MFDSETLMDSSKQAPSHHDQLRINLSDAEQVRRWTADLGISADELAKIVARVGNTAENVFEHLLLRRPFLQEVRHHLNR
jgi:hypothetical protein